MLLSAEAGSDDLFGAEPGSAPVAATVQAVQVSMDDEPTASGGTADRGEPPTEVVALTGGVDLATCPACRAVNAVQRPRCARCGVDLHAAGEVVDDGGAPGAVPEDVAAVDLAEPVSADEAGVPRRRGPRGLGIAIVVGGAVVGAVLAAVMFGLGPFDRSGGHGIDFVGADYPGQAATLDPVSVTTTAVRPPDAGRTFGAPNVGDDALTTAWVGLDGDDASLTFEFGRPVWIVAVEVANGDQFDAESFPATARVRTLGVDFGFGSGLEATLISGTGWQGFRPPEPILVDTVTLDVLDLTEGQDVGLSEVRFVGFAANPSDSQAFADVG